MAEPLSDRDLVARCLAGDAAAWEALVLRYRRTVFGVLRKMRLSVEDAEDLMQDVFATLLRKLGQVRDHERLGLWLAVMARRRAMDHWQLARVRREVAMAPEFDAPGLNLPPIEDLIAIERREAVRQAVAAMSPRCRALLQALYFQNSDPTYREVARKLGIAEGSLGPTRMRCLETLRRILAEHGFTSS